MIEVRAKKLEWVDLLPGLWDVAPWLVGAGRWVVKWAKARGTAPEKQPRHLKVTAGPIAWSVDVSQATGTVTKARDGSA